MEASSAVRPRVQAAPRVDRRFAGVFVLGVLALYALFAWATYTLLDSIL